MIGVIINLLTSLSFLPSCPFPCLHARKHETDGPGGGKEGGGERRGEQPCPALPCPAMEGM